MRRLLVRPFLLAATLFSAVFLALIATVSVSAAPASLFTNNGCTVGNYACLQAMGVHFPHIHVVVPYPVPGYAPAYGAMPYPTSYTNSYMPSYASMPASTTSYGTSGSATATIVSGHAVAAGQQVAATVDGFTPGEMVSASVTAPNGQVMQVGSAAAAADGSVTVMVSFPSAGTWMVTTHGQTSNRSVVDTFTVH
jgi:hypothetical protein